jgi:type II pantothenate kinase
VNIGSGVSILRFESATDVQRIGGTSLGGGMFLGLCNTLTGINDYDKLLEMSHDGKNSNDLLLREVQKKNSFDFDGA